MKGAMAVIPKNRYVVNHLKNVSFLNFENATTANDGNIISAEYGLVRMDIAIGTEATIGWSKNKKRQSSIKKTAVGSGRMVLE
jgi:hypothetical protein